MTFTKIVTAVKIVYFAGVPSTPSFIRIQIQRIGSIGTTMGIKKLTIRKYLSKEKIEIAFEYIVTKTNIVPIPHSNQ